MCLSCFILKVVLAHNFLRMVAIIYCVDNKRKVVYWILTFKCLKAVYCRGCIGIAPTFEPQNSSLFGYLWAYFLLFNFLEDF